MSEQSITIDKIKWWVPETRVPQPLCLVHHLRLYPVKDVYCRFYPNLESHSLKCQECKELHIISRSIADEKQYVIDKLDAQIFRGMRFINLDDEALPIAEDKIKSKDSKYFVTSLLTQSKTGLRLVVYAGEKGSDKKTQIFVEPDIKRLAFDQKDLHPNDVFAELEATFADGSKHKMKK